jgi:hypothetical protein
VQEPTYSSASIASSGATGPGPLAPGRVASIYGSHLGPIQPCQGSPDPNLRDVPNPLRPNQTTIETQVFPDNLCDTNVEVGGVAAGLLYVSAGQINFKVPQTVRTEGETSVRVRYKGQSGPPVSISLTTDSPSSPAEQIAAGMWSRLQRVRWQRDYTPKSGACTAIAPHQNLRGGLYDYAYYCASTEEDVVAESFYYPIDRTAPKVRLMRADIRPLNAYPELSAEVEQLLTRRLTQAYGAGAVSENLYEIGASRPEPGLFWRNGNLAIFLHRNRSYVQPAGVRQGVVLIAVREEILEQRRQSYALDEATRSSTSLSHPAIVQDLERQLPGMFFAAAAPGPQTEPQRAQAERQTRSALLRLLRLSTDERERRAAALVAADELARRLGGLLIVRSARNGSELLAEDSGADKIRIQLASHGVRFGEIGHYSGELTYDHSLLKRAWNENPDTSWGQRAFLMLQRLGCATPVFGCDGPNCFRSVIEQGESFLERYPDTPFRKEQTYHLALANDAWWSLAHAQPGDITAEGARVTKASAERARQKAVKLYEELILTAPGSPEAHAAEIALPRLKLKLDTGERTFFCFSC